MLEILKTIALTGMGIQKKALETLEEFISHDLPRESSQEKMADNFMSDDEGGEKISINSPDKLLEKIETFQKDLKKLKKHTAKQEERISKLETSDRQY